VRVAAIPSELPANVQLLLKQSLDFKSDARPSFSHIIAAFDQDWSALQVPSPGSHSCLGCQATPSSDPEKSERLPEHLSLLPVGPQADVAPEIERATDYHQESSREGRKEQDTLSVLPPFESESSAFWLLPVHPSAYASAFAQASEANAARYLF